jgi:hypothetical protein
VDEHVLSAIIADDEAEAFLRIEEFDDAFAFADDLGRHSAGTAAAAAETATAAAAAVTTAAAVAEATAAAAEAAAVTEAAASAAIAASSAAAAAIAAALLETAAKFWNTLFAETVALVATAATALTLAPSIETHIRPNSFSPVDPSKPTRSGKKAQPVKARNPLTHRSRHYSKNNPCSSDSNCCDFRQGWQGGRQAD